MWVSQSVSDTVEPSWLMCPGEGRYLLAMKVMDTEDDKVADMVLKIPDDDFTDVTVAIGDTYGGDVNDVGGGHWGWQAAQPGGQISN